MRRRFSVLLLWVAVLCALVGCADIRPTSSAAAFIEAVGEMDGVVRVVHDESAETVRIDLDPDADPAHLQRLSDDIFALRTDHQYPDLTEVTLVVGSFTADLGDVNPGPGTPQPAAPELGAVSFLAALPEVVGGSVEYRHYAVQVVDGTDPWQWIVATSAAGVELDGDYGLSVSAGEEGGHRVVLGDEGADDELQRVAVMLAGLPAEVVAFQMWRHQADRPPEMTVDLRLPQLADAHVVADAFAAEFGKEADERIDLGVTTADGFSLRPVRQVDAYLKLADQLTDSGVTLTSASPDRDSLSVVVTDAQALRRLAELMTHPDWPLSSETSVTVSPQAQPTSSSRAPAEAWQEQAELLAQLWEEGLLETRIHSGRGDVDQDISIRSSDGADITRDPTRTTVIRILRDHAPPGRTDVHIAEGDHLRFWTTPTGTAQEAYMSLHGADRTPRGWAADFLAAWDATAS